MLSYPNLLSTELQKLLHTSGEWRLYWKQKVFDSPEFDLLQWWENAGPFMGLPNLANEALNVLVFQVTTSVVEGSFHRLCLCKKNIFFLAG